MTRRLRVLAVVGLLVWCGSSFAASSSTAKAHCGSATAQTLAASDSGRVYAVNGSVYGCSVHGKTIYKLGARTLCIGSPCVEAVAVAGELAGYGLEQCGVDTCSAWVVVRRLTDGKHLRSLSAISKPLGVEFFQSVDSVVLKRDEAVAWIAEGSSIQNPARDVEVHKADTGGEALLDSGAAIKSGSLRLHGSSVTWKHGKLSRSAMLH